MEPPPCTNPSAGALDPRTTPAAAAAKNFMICKGTGRIKMVRQGLFVESIFQCKEGRVPTTKKIEWVGGYAKETARVWRPMRRESPTLRRGPRPGECEEGERERGRNSSRLFWGAAQEEPVLMLTTVRRCCYGKPSREKSGQILERAVMVRLVERRRAAWKRQPPSRES